MKGARFPAGDRECSEQLAFSDPRDRLQSVERTDEAQPPTDVQTVCQRRPSRPSAHSPDSYLLYFLETHLYLEHRVESPQPLGYDTPTAAYSAHPRAGTWPAARQVGGGREGPASKGSRVISRCVRRVPGRGRVGKNILPTAANHRPRPDQPGQNRASEDPGGRGEV